ncbi:MAG: hypothetical protein JNL58_08070 [Planctomyces sp.]|nr:hypothetical protein [Planctomyces sp.]
MALKIWRGDAPAVSQVTRVTPANVEVGDIFTLTINGKALSVTATAATAANVVDLFVAAIAASEIPEFTEFVATNDANTLLLTAAEPGVPFTFTASTTNAGKSDVNVVTTTQGSTAATEVQKFTIPSAATGGTWKITFGSATTAALNVGDSAGTVQTALQGLSTVGSGNATVSKSGDEYTVTFASALASQNVAPLVVALYLDKPLIDVVQNGASFGPPQNEIQRLRLPSSDVTSKTFTLTFNGDTTASQFPPITASGLQGWLRLQWQDVNTVNVTDDTATGGYLIEFTGSAGNANQPTITAASTWTAAEGRYDITVTTTTEGAANANEVQTITLSPTPTGGTFTLTYAGQTTSPIAYNASAATVDTALEALSNIGVGDVTVTGSAGGPWTVTFGGALANTNVQQITGNGSGLTGAATQTFTAAQVTASSGPNHWDTAANWLPAGVPANSDDVSFEIGDSDCLYGLDQTSVTLTSLSFASTWTGALGLPRVNELGYVEYRTRDLTIKCPTVLIGHGEGSGSGKIQLNTLNAACALEVRNSGGSRESGVPAITWYGDHASNSIVMLSGDLGIAVWSDQTAEINTIRQYGGQLRINRSSINDLYAPGQQVSAHETTIGGMPVEL